MNNITMRFDTTDYHKIFIDTSDGGAQNALVLLRNSDGIIFVL